MMHGLETMKAMNEAASCEAVADVRHVFDHQKYQAFYIDGLFFVCFGSRMQLSLYDFSNFINKIAGRVVKVSRVTLADDFNKCQSWPAKFDELIPYIETES